MKTIQLKRSIHITRWGVSLPKDTDLILLEMDGKALVEHPTRKSLLIEVDPKNIKR